MTHYGVVIGRFQPFHLGHQSIIDTIIADGLEPLIIIGSTNVPLSHKNPFTATERANMITLATGITNIKFLPDYDSWDDWFDHLKSLLPTKCTIYLHDKPEDRCDFTYNNIHYISQSYSKLFELNNISTKQLPISSIPICATDIRSNPIKYNQYLHDDVYPIVLNKYYSVLNAYYGIAVGNTYALNNIVYTLEAIDNTKTYNLTLRHGTMQHCYRTCQVINSLKEQHANNNKT